MADSRSELARRQAALLQTLLRARPAPDGFDVQRLQACGESLLRKRMRAVTRSFPALARALGGEFAAQFACYAADHPLPAAGGSLADGHAFARWLSRERRLNEAAAWEQVAVELRWRVARDGLHPRLAPAIAWRRTDEGHLLLAAGWKRRAWFHIRLPLPTRRRVTSFAPESTR